jgi:septum formation protein
MRPAKVMPIVLASTSPYRRELLRRLQLPFEVEAPLVDEAPHATETPRAVAVRLAQAKANEVARRRPGAVVIGSDQVADLDGVALSKPGTHAAAAEQLMAMQGRVVVFHTALAVVSPAGVDVDCVDTAVTFRKRSRAQIERYLRAERPYDCAGAAKIESLGIALVERVDSCDPTALIGLPLIRLTDLLERHGIAPLGDR